MFIKIYIYPVYLDTNIQPKTVNNEQTSITPLLPVIKNQHHLKPEYFQKKSLKNSTRVRRDTSKKNSVLQSKSNIKPIKSNAQYVPIYTHYRRLFESVFI